jgi:hypothetical protein
MLRYIYQYHLVFPHCLIYIDIKGYINKMETLIAVKVLGMLFCFYRLRLSWQCGLNFHAVSTVDVSSKINDKRCFLSVRGFCSLMKREPGIICLWLS